MTISSSRGISWFPSYANRATLRRSSHRCAGRLMLLQNLHFQHQVGGGYVLAFTESACSPLVLGLWRRNPTDPSVSTRRTSVSYQRNARVFERKRTGIWLCKNARANLHEFCVRVVLRKLTKNNRFRAFKRVSSKLRTE